MGIAVDKMMAASCIGDILTGRLLYQLTGTPFQFLTDLVLGSKNIPLELYTFGKNLKIDSLDVFPNIMARISVIVEL